MKNRFNKTKDHGVLLDQLEDIINEYGMELLLSSLITILYSYGTKQRYITDLIRDLSSTLKRYKDRYE